MNRLRLRLHLPSRSCFFAPIILLIPVFSAVPQLASQALWTSVGPPGGDARALVAVPGQPSHLYLGTTNSWIYESLDEGASWHRLARLEPSEDVVLDSILVDAANPAVLYAGGWKAEQRDGGLWVSHDGGKQWKAVEALRGQSILSLAQAPSNPSLLFVGTLEGVFRSSDGGSSWRAISPPGSREIHEVESLAVDPANPNIVYAGTWHLPWKTTDGGKSWHSIKKGLIDDSDVFSMVVDPASPKTVFLSACSGIYKSESGGELFHKIEGIPATARRTRVLTQDPENREVVYAGTTEGLYKTVDGGRIFRRMTGPDVVVNSVFVDPEDSNRVLLATDRGGVLASMDAGASFAAANQGFSGRKVAALLVDRGNPARLYAGVVNDKSYGGVFVSSNGGEAWEQVGEEPGGGLDGRDVFALAQAADGTVLAGTSHGIFALDADNHPNDKDQSSEPPGSASGKPVWRPRNTIANTRTKTAAETHYGKRVNVEKQVKDPAFELASRVNAMDLSGDVWVASTGFGLLTSGDQGASWQGGAVMGSNEYLSVTANGALMAAAGPDGVVLSTDAGSTWMPMGIPTMLTRIHRVAFSADGTLWLGAREGVYFTRDKGKTWLWIERLPFRDVDDVYYDAVMNKVLVSSRASDQVYAIDPKTLHWTWSRTGYGIALIRAAGDRLVAASLYDGVLVEPQASGAENGQK
ncbi:MAG: transcriptional regulator [Terracidiphilus sp.]